VSNVSFSSNRKGVLSFAAQDPSSASSGESVFEKNLEVISQLHLIREQIDGPLYYHPALLAQRLEGPVHVRVRLAPDGKLRRLDPDSWSGHHVLRGWVTKVLVDALSDPYLKTPMKRDLDLDLQFDFKIAEDQTMFTYGDEMGPGTLFFYVYEVLPAPYEPGLPLIQTIARKLESQPPARDKEWDWDYRQEFFASACENSRGQGGCEEAAKIAAQLGQHEEEARFLRMKSGE